MSQDGYLTQSGWNPYIANENNKLNHFSIELTTTAMCNLGCTYCFEGVKTDKRRLDDKVDVIKERIHEFLKADWFLKNYDQLNISFWGGEPTLNPDLVIDIVQEFQQLDNVSFHIYTNAFNRARFEKIVQNVNLKKLHVQISYDGEDISNKFRVTHSGKGSASQVLDNMNYFARTYPDLDISLKSTIPLTALGSLHKTWLDFKKLNDHFSDCPNLKVSYAPTIDYVSDLPDQIIPESVAIFRSEFIKIAKEEITFFQKNGRYLCTWFGAGDTKVHCASGAHMHAINVDGKGYACHGSFYSPNKDEMLGSDIESSNFVNEVIAMSEKYKAPLHEVNDICKGCVATTCMICPVSSLDLSKKESFVDRWQDRWVNNMCGFFKAFGEIDRSVQAYLEKDLVLKSSSSQTAPTEALPQ
jgi:sulfatase maturation enzyme AslB (radical SAM superfamily)